MEESHKKIIESSEKINFVSSTNNFWVSKTMFKKWDFYSNEKNINLYIYSNSQVNKFMYRFFKDDLIYEIYKKSVIPVQKIDIFRICFIYLFGGIWLDLKSEINIKKVKKLYNSSFSKGILLSEPRKIEVIKVLENKKVSNHENVIHNGFFYLPKNSTYLKTLIEKIKDDFLYFQDISFEHPKQAIMNLTGPHQFTRTFHELKEKDRPLLCSHNEVGWNYCSKFGEYITPFKKINHYSSIKKLKTIDSKVSLILEE